MSGRRDVGDDYARGAEELAALVGEIIPAMRHMPPRTFGGVWREKAKAALSRFRAAQLAGQQRTLFDGGNDAQKT